MSYSFTIRTKTKAQALEQLPAQFDKVVAQQPTHEVDRAQAQAAAAAFVGITSDPATDQHVQLAVNGSTSWSTVDGQRKIGYVSVGITCSLVHESSPGALTS